jgi:hypothetical protein
MSESVHPTQEQVEQARREALERMWYFEEYGEANYIDVTTLAEFEAAVRADERARMERE